MQKRVESRSDFLPRLFSPFSLRSARPCPKSVSRFRGANKLYYEAQFTNAASVYEKLIQSGQHAPSLYFNLGNAWFKSGQIGRAIAAYRHADSLPREIRMCARISSSLEISPGTLIFPQRLATLAQQTHSKRMDLLATGPVWLWFLLLAAPAMAATVEKQFPHSFICPGCRVTCLCGCLAAALYEDRGFQTAVVIAREAVVRHGPLEESQNSFAVHDGAELRVLDRKMIG